MRRLILLSLAVGLAGCAGMTSQGSDSHAMHKTVMPDQVKWAPASAALPPGAMSAVLDGDPGKAGPFTMRAKIPAGYTVPPHWHSQAEHITVLSGSLYIGHGDKLDKAAATRLAPGSFAMMPAKMHHYAFSTEEAIFQIHGTGPFDINYLNPADDPRTKSAAK